MDTTKRTSWLARTVLRCGWLWVSVTVTDVCLAQAESQAPIDTNPSLAIGVGEGFTLAAVGDMILTKAVSARRDPDLQAVVSILRGAAVTFGNFESSAIDMRWFEGSPQAEFGGLWVRSDPDVVADLKAMGFDVVSRANNHSTDWGIEGMLETDRRLDEAGIVHAGTGFDRARARAGRYLSTPFGTVAIVSMASSFTPISRSMDALGTAPGRAGLSALRTIRRVLVTRRMMEGLRRVYDAQPEGSYRPPRDTVPGELTLFGVRYRVSDTLRNEVAFTFEMDTIDLREITNNIRQAKLNSDFVIATIHAHEPGNWSEVPADFLPTLARATIDHGADAFVGHGPHQLRGIEIYRGKPIFYSLGNFFFQVSPLEPIGADLYEAFHHDPDVIVDAEFHETWRKGYFDDPVWYEAVVAVSRFGPDGVSEIRLHPVELTFEGRDAERGLPRRAPPALARKILERLERLSRPYGTVLHIEGEVGVIRPTAGARANR